MIASRLGGLPFTVIDGKTGLLFQPGNAEDLAAKIEVLLDDPELRERMGLEGRLRFVREYSWERMIKRHYAPLLKARRDGPHPNPLPEGEGARPIRLSVIVSVLESYEVVRRQHAVTRSDLRRGTQSAPASSAAHT